MPVPRYGFAVIPDHPNGGKRVIGNFEFPGDYLSRSGQFIVDAFTPVARTLSIDDLDVLGLMNGAYQQRLDDEFRALRMKAQGRLSATEFATLRVFDGVA